MRLALCTIVCLIGATPAALAWATRPGTDTRVAQAKLEAKQEARAAAAKRPATKAELDELRAEVARLSEQVAELVAHLDELRRKLEGAKSEGQAEGGDTAAEAPGENIQDAIREKRLTIGMTLAQANEALGVKGKIDAEDEEGKTYLWRTPTTRAGSGRASGGKPWWSARVVDGRIVSCERL